MEQTVVHYFELGEKERESSFSCLYPPITYPSLLTTCILLNIQ